MAEEALPVTPEEQSPTLHGCVGQLGCGDVNPMVEEEKGGSSCTSRNNDNEGGSSGIEE